MAFEESLRTLFEDLEQQAEGLALAERDAELAERGAAEYAEITLEARLHASVGRGVTVTVTGLGLVEGTLSRVATGWFLLETPTVPPREWVVVTGAVGSVTGASERAVSKEARPVTARLGLRSALRGLATDGGEVLVHARDGTVVRGTLGRVGADFMELFPAAERGPGAATSLLLAFGAIAAVRRA
jgi:hypothetical protein